MSNQDQFKHADREQQAAKTPDQRWAARLGLKPGETPVSMTDMVVSKSKDGGYTVGG